MKRSSWSHLGVCPPRRSVSVFFASFPSLAAQYGFCFPIVFRFGRFLARSTTTTSVPISGPSTVISAKIPLVWLGPLGLSSADAIFAACMSKDRTKIELVQGCVTMFEKLREVMLRDARQGCCPKPYARIDDVRRTLCSKGISAQCVGFGEVVLLHADLTSLRANLDGEGVLLLMA